MAKTEVPLSTNHSSTSNFTRYMAEVNRIPLLSREEEYRLAVLASQGDREAARTLVAANLRFVVKVANKYRHYGLNMADLVQEGNLGLMKAVEKFDPDRGYRVISYGVWWIKAYIQAFILRSWSLVKIGTTQAQRKLFYKLKETRRRMGEEGRQATVELVARELNVSVEAVAEMDLRLASRDFFLDAPVNDGEGKSTHLDLLADADANQELRVAQADLEARVRWLAEEGLQRLTEKERFVVRHRLMTVEPVTLQSIGDHFRISRERVRQIEANAKRKLKAFFLEASADLPVAA